MASDQQLLRNTSCFASCCTKQTLSWKRPLLPQKHHSPLVDNRLLAVSTSNTTKWPLACLPSPLNNIEARTSNCCLKSSFPLLTLACTNEAAVCLPRHRPTTQLSDNTNTSSDSRKANNMPSDSDTAASAKTSCAVDADLQDARINCPIQQHSRTPSTRIPQDRAAPRQRLRHWPTFKASVARETLLIAVQTIAAPPRSRS